MAMSQIEQALKFELLVPVHSAEQPTACMSFNYHRDHFGTTWNLRNARRRRSRIPAASPSAWTVWRWRCSPPTASSRAMADAGPPGALDGI